MTWSFKAEEREVSVYMDNLFTQDECNEIIRIGNENKKEEAGMSADLYVDKEYRTTLVCWIDPNKDTAWIYDRISKFIVEANDNFFKFKLFGFNEKLQFAEYNYPDGHYKKHVDWSKGNSVRKLSIVLQLTDPQEYEGGDLLLHYQEDPVYVTKRQGTATLFPSFLLHEVLPVTKGTRYSLAGWVTGDPFI